MVGSARAAVVKDRPPLARGRRQPFLGLEVARRTSPARAGTTSRSKRCPSCTWDQPRSRGDDRSLHILCAARSGPAPLARERHAAGFADVAGDGTSPARAGTTEWHAGSARAWWDQPRSRGDDTDFGLQAYLHVGPAPLARGRQLTTRRGDRDRRTSPARAGTTILDRSTKEGTRDQPRSRGDDTGGSAVMVNFLGPAPLARGRPPPPAPGPSRPWTSPARAGTTVVFM